MKVSEPCLSQFLETYSAKGIVEGKTCFLKQEKPALH